MRQSKCHMNKIKFIIIINFISNLYLIDLIKIDPRFIMDKFNLLTHPPPPPPPPPHLYSSFLLPLPLPCHHPVLLMCLLTVVKLEISRDETI